MALNKYKLGELVTLVDERNCLGIREFYGINIHKEFMPTVANTDPLDETKYKVVRKNRFVYSGMQTGRDECIRISMYKGEEPIIVSPAYLTFEVTAREIVVPEYFFMFFLSKEKDRLGWFRSDGSIRSNLDWNVFCDIDIALPPIEVQQKYVDIYQGMVKNQQAYERGLEDLKLVCDGYFDVAKKRYSCLLGCLIEKVDERNSNSLYFEKDVRGINNKKEFSKTKADISTADLSKFKVVRPHQFAYNSRTDGRDMLVLALNREETPIIVTFNYNVFKIRQEKSFLVDVNYLYAFFKRAEFDRRVRFNSWGSSQELLSWDNLCNIEVPLPNIEEQKSLAEIINLYIERKEINEKLKSKIKAICPILIKGSLDETRR